jgi:hypothetical protein
VAEGEGEGEAFSLVSFLVVSFLVVSVDAFLVVSVDFLVVSVDDFFVVDFLVVEVLAGAFSGAVVVAVSVLLVLQEARSPAANMTVME